AVVICVGRKGKLAGGRIQYQSAANRASRQRVGQFVAFDIRSDNLPSDVFIFIARQGLVDNVRRAIQVAGIATVELSTTCLAYWVSVVCKRLRISRLQNPGQAYKAIAAIGAT